MLKSLREIARKEGVASSYVSRIVNLTPLAPDIVAAILDDTLLPEPDAVRSQGLPSAALPLWKEQRNRLGE